MHLKKRSQKDKKPNKTWADQGIEFLINLLKIF